MWEQLSGGEDEVGKKLRALNATIDQYEHENQKQKLAIEGNEVVRLKQQEKIDAYEKKQQQLQKKILSLESSIRLEKKGYEGLIKKAGLMELELPGLREECGTLKKEQILTRAQIAQYEIDLNNDRAKRLQILHENQILQDKNKEVEAAMKQQADELKGAREKQLTGLQQLDSSAAGADTLQAIITEQNNNIITMCSELQGLQNQCRELTTLNHASGQQVAELLLTVRAQEEEIRRLRGIILNHTAEQAANPAGFGRSGTAAANKRRERGTTAGGGAGSTVRAGTAASSTGGGAGLGGSGMYSPSINAGAGTTFGTGGGSTGQPQQLLQSLSNADLSQFLRSGGEWGATGTGAGAGAGTAGAGGGGGRGFTKSERDSVYRHRVEGSDGAAKHLRNVRPSSKLHGGGRSTASSGAGSPTNMQQQLYSIDGGGGGDGPLSLNTDAGGMGPPTGVGTRAGTRAPSRTGTAGQFSPMRGGAGGRGGLGLTEGEASRDSPAAELGATGSAGGSTSYVTPAEELQALMKFHEHQSAPVLSPQSTPYIPTLRKVAITTGSASAGASRPTTTSGPAVRYRSSKYADAGVLSKTLPSLQRGALGSASGDEGGLGTGPGGDSGGGGGGGGIYGAAAGLTLNTSSELRQSMQGQMQTMGQGQGQGGSSLMAMVEADRKAAEARRDAAAEKLSEGPKSMYVGQGLGLKTSDKTQYKAPKGSTKAMLKKVLADLE